MYATRGSVKQLRQQLEASAAQLKQQLGDSSENDRKFFELLTPIASFIVGALGGVMAAGNNKQKGGNDEPPTQEYTE